MSSSAGRRASGGIASRCSRSSDAAATSAVTGVRSSCATSAVNRRSRACAADSAATLACNASAIWLNDAAQVPNSSPRPAGSRVSSRPSAIERAAALARPTGSRVRRASALPTSAASATVAPQPASSTVRSCPSSSWIRSSVDTKYNSASAFGTRAPSTSSRSRSCETRSNPSSPSRTVDRSSAPSAGSKRGLDARRDPAGHQHHVLPVLLEAGQQIRAALGVKGEELLGEHQLEPRLRLRARQRVLQPRLPHEQERAQRERARRHPRHQDERDREPPAEPARGDRRRHVTPDRGCSRRRGPCGSAGAWSDRPRSSPAAAAPRRPPAGSRRGSRSSTRGPAGCPG